jgi:hypothetical protein
MRESAYMCVEGESRIEDDPEIANGISWGDRMSREGESIEATTC